jgi:hypothetical protein
MERLIYPTLPVASPQALIFWCGDPRIQAAVNGFIAKELGLKNGDYIAITVLGGIASFSEQLKLPKDFKFMRDTLQFSLDNFGSLTRVILINHEDCARYRAFSGRLGSAFLRGAGSIVERQRADLTNVGRTIASLAGRSISCEGYYGAFANPEHTMLRFEKQT